MRCASFVGVHQVEVPGACCCVTHRMLPPCLRTAIGTLLCSRDEARSSLFALESACKGNKFGQCELGWMYSMGEGGVAHDR